MPRFSHRSLGRLDTADNDLQIVAHEAIKYVDFSVRFGYRDPALQFELFQSGRVLRGDKWVLVNKKLWKTNCDGYKILSDHNADPSKALDLVPYPYPKDRIDLINEFFYLAGIVMGLAAKLRAEGIIQNRIFWGGRWKSVDRPHFYIKKKP